MIGQWVAGGSPINPYCASTPLIDAAGRGTQALRNWYMPLPDAAENRAAADDRQPAVNRAHRR
jgi:hypothetical protein